MQYACIRCNKRWNNGLEEKDPDGLISHGLCKDCARTLLIPTIRRKQLREGFWDCFGKAERFCDRNCKYRMVCLH